MPGHRFFIDSLSATPGALVELSERDSHHARGVLRLGTGDEITVILKSNGAAFTAAIVDSAELTRATIIGPTSALAGVSRVKQLLFALCKGDRNDFVCEKATELGVGAIHLFQAQRSIVKLDTQKDIEKKLERWRKIVEGASKQSNRAEVPEIIFSRSLAEAVAHPRTSPADRKFFCSLSHGAAEFRMVVPPSGPVHLTIGPEGDLTGEEESSLLANGFEPLSLGPTVLRSETAAIAALSMALGVWGYS